MSPRRTIAAAAAGVGAACFLALAIVPAGAAIEQVPIYSSLSKGEGVVFAGAVTPSILETAGEFGGHYAEVNYSSQGGGSTQSIAAPFYPGKFAMGALTANVGCGGLKGWVEARYPASQNPVCKSEQSDAVFRPERSSIGSAFGAPQIDDAVNDVFDMVRPGAGEMRATAGLAQGTARIVTTGFTMRTDDPPVIEIGSIGLNVNGIRPVAGILTNTTRVVAKDISLFGGGIKIASLESRATTTSDGESATADAALTFGRVTVMVDGVEREATIDNNGIRVTDPAFSAEQALNITENIEDALLRAGVSITAGTPVEITDGAHGEASVGGLALSFKGTPPSVVIPDALAPVYGMIIDEIPPQCLTDYGAPLPLCFGAGIVPLGGSEVIGSLTIGRAASFSIGARPIPHGDPVPPVDPVSPVGPITPGGPIVPPFDSFPPPGTGTPPADQPTVPVAQPQGPLVGLVARMQDEWLAFAGALATILAFGLAAWPSLRDGRTS